MVYRFIAYFLAFFMVGLPLEEEGEALSLVNSRLIEEVSTAKYQEGIFEKKPPFLDGEKTGNMKVLKRDLEEFKEKGSSGISRDNSLYLINRTGLSAEELEIPLRGTELEGLGRAFCRAEREHGVNAIFLMSLANHESDRGRSRIARDKNNLFGFTANDSDPYNSAMTFSSKEECIDYVAAFLKDNYLDPKGIYYNGDSLESINLRYASDEAWAEKVESEMIRETQMIIEEN